MYKACICDTETNGLIRTRLIPLDKQPEIIELYACCVDLDTGEIFGEIESLFKPHKDISAEITKITHITNDMLKDAPSFASKADAIKSFIESAPIFIAHNCSFDAEILDIEFERLGKNIEWHKKLCSVEQTVHLVGHRQSLTALYQYLFNEKFKDAHRARTDVEALTRCCVELRKRNVL